MELSQAHRLPYHHFSGTHVRSLIRPHWVILESSGRTKCTSCYTREYFPRLPHMARCVNCYTGAYSSFLLWRWSSSHKAITIFFIQLRDIYSHYWLQYRWFMPRWAFKGAWPLGFDCLITYDSSIDRYVRAATIAPVDHFLETRQWIIPLRWRQIPLTRYLELEISRLLWYFVKPHDLVR